MPEQTELPGIATPNPLRYSQMCAARTQSECDAAIEAFYKDVMAIRAKHGIADVHVILRVNIVMDDCPEGELPGMASMHIGSEQEAEGMCAWAFARAGETRRNFVDRQKLHGINHAKRR